MVSWSIKSYHYLSIPVSFGMKLLLLVIGINLNAEPISLMENFSSCAGKLSFTCSADFTQEFLNNPTIILTYPQDPEISNLDQSVQQAPFLMGLAPLIWVSNKEYSIEVMDYDLFYSLEQIKEVFKRFYPSLAWSGKLTPKALKKNVPIATSDAITILFSGGLDSTFTSFNHLNKHQHLVTLRGVDVKLGNDAAWQGTWQHCSTFAQEYKHELTSVTFNLQSRLIRDKLKNICPEIKSWWAYTMGSLTHVGIALPLAYLKGDRYIHIAASNTRECPRPYGNHPLIDNALFVGGVQAVHDGGHLCRTGKIRKIAQQAQKYSLKLPSLRVCQRSELGQNCGTCIGKCILTINNVLAAGYNPLDFGLPLNLNQMMDITQNNFTKKPTLAWGPWFDWMSVYRAVAAKNFKNITLDSLPGGNLYVTWFTHLPFKLSKKALKTKKLFQSYWQELWDAAYQPGTKDYSLLNYPPSF